VGAGARPGSLPWAPAAEMDSSVGADAGAVPEGEGAQPAKARHPVTMMILAAAMESRVTEEV